MDIIGKHYEVKGALSDVIKHFYCIETSADFESISQHLSPNLEMILALNFGDPVQISFGNDEYDELQVDHIGLIGPLRRLLNYRVPASASLIVAEFHADGFYRLFQVSMAEMKEEILYDPDILLATSAFGELWSSLTGISLLGRKIALLEEFLSSMLTEQSEITSSLIGGIAYLNNPLVQPVRAMARDSETSERTIQSRFRKYVGYSSKELLRFLRFKQVIGAIVSQEIVQVDWLELVETFGYHDQSHLIKDFRHFLGTSPQKFVNEVAGKDFCTSRPGKYY